MAARFEAFPDPLNNWIVWDLYKDDFAVCDGRPADGLNERDAVALCDMLNQAELQTRTAMAAA